MKLSIIHLISLALTVTSVSASGAVKFDFHSFKNVPHRNHHHSNAHSKHYHRKFKDNEYVKHYGQSDSTVSVITSPSPSPSPSASIISDETIRSDVNLTTSYNFYLTNITIGTPPQSLEVGLDTGSPYLWVFGPETTYNNAVRFFPNESSSFEWLNKNFSGLYGAGGVFGKWGQDNVGVNGVRVNQFPFGVINQYQLATGVPGLIGVGPNSNLTNQTYANVPEAFYRQGVTKSAAFSVFLDSEATGGAVIFGGVDRSRYEEPVYSYDIVRSGSQKISYYQLGLTTLSLNHGDPYDVFGIAVLDTGSPFSQLPPGFVNKVGQALGFTFYENYQAWYKPANDTTPIMYNNTISMTFGKFTADIPIKDLIVPGEYLWSQDGPQGVQALAMMGTNQYVIGDHLFKNAYITFDSLAGKIYLAKSLVNGKSDIVDLDESGFPGAISGLGGAAESRNPYEHFTYTTLTSRPPVTSSSKASTVTVTATTTLITSSAPTFYTAV